MKVIRMIDINTISIPKSTSKFDGDRVDGVAWGFISHGDDDDDKGLVINRDFNVMVCYKLVGLI